MSAGVDTGVSLLLPPSHTQHHPGWRVPFRDPEGTSDNRAFRKAFLDGGGNLFYALLITVTIYKIHDKHKVLTKIVFQMVFTCNRITFVCNSWIYELLHNKMALLLDPMGAWVRGPQMCHGDRNLLRENCDSRCTSNSWHFGFYNLETWGLWWAREVGLGKINFLSWGILMSQSWMRLHAWII